MWPQLGSLTPLLICEACWCCSTLGDAFWPFFLPVKRYRVFIISLNIKLNWIIFKLKVFSFSLLRQTGAVVAVVVLVGDEVASAWWWQCWWVRHYVISRLDCIYKQIKSTKCLVFRVATIDYSLGVYLNDANDQRIKREYCAREGVCVCAILTKMLGVISIKILWKYFNSHTSLGNGRKSLNEHEP